MSALDFYLKRDFNNMYYVRYSVLDLNAFERQNKAEGLGMVSEEGTSKSVHLNMRTVLRHYNKMTSKNIYSIYTHLWWPRML